MEIPVIKVGTLIINEKAKQYINQVLESNRLSYGPFTQKFESEFAKLHGCQFAVMSNSGTSALHIALAALKEIHGWRDGDEVIVPAVTFIATPNIVLHNNMVPVFVDVDKDYYELNPTLIEAKVTDRTRAIIPVHLFGQPCDMDPIMETTEKHGLKVVEDSCETMFAHYKQKSVGSLGDIGCFSTYVAHLIVTGVGGLSTTNNPDYAIKLRSLMNHGRDAIYISIDDDENKTHEELRTIIARRFSFVSLGHSFRVTELEAALGLAQLEIWGEIIAQRRQNAKYLVEGLSNLNEFIQLPQIRPKSEHSFMMFPIVLRRDSKEDFVNYLEQNGIETRDMFPLINQPVYQKLFQLNVQDYPIANWINRSGFYIGCHQDLNTIDLEYVIDVFHDYFIARQRKKKKLKKATLVITTLNALEPSQRLYESLPLEMFDQCLVIDRGSSDGTADFWEGKPVQFLQQPKADQAESFARGAHLAEGKFIVFYKIDDSQNPEDIARLVYLLDRGNDLVIASRFMPGGRKSDANRFIPYRGFGNRIFTLLANLLFNGNLTDSLGRLRAIKKKNFEEMKLKAGGLGFQYQMSIRALKAGLKVTEMPTIETTVSREDKYPRILVSIFQLLGIAIKELFIGKRYLKRNRKR